MISGDTVIAVDIGNTRAKFGLFQCGADNRMSPLQIHAVVLSSAQNLQPEFFRWKNSLQPFVLHSILVAGSDPDCRDDFLTHWPPGEMTPFVVSGGQQIPLKIDVDFPARVGIDRLLNVYAAGRSLPQKRSVIVIDSGTATTVDLMTSDGVFRGGTILPGLRLSAIAMHEYTARLPLVNVDDDSGEPPVLPGRNTEAAMKAGLFWGQLGAVREITGQLTMAAKTQFGETQPPALFLTGGGGRQMLSHLPEARFVDSLALHGLAMLSQTRECP